MPKKGILLINLGTPASPKVRDVRRFLAEFLRDPYVIDVPAIIRYLILYGFILPFRPKRSAAAYRAIWTDQGSPLLLHSQELCAQLAAELGDEFTVVFGMRYGEPSLMTAIKALQQSGCSDLKVVPLFPQYSLATTESCIQRVKKIMQQLDYKVDRCDFIQDFYDHPAYIAAQARCIHDKLQEHPEVKQLIMSFHGVPVRQIKKVEADGKACQQQHACPAITASNRLCYRAQCYATARALAAQLPDSIIQYEVGFQSRLGKNPWIEPVTTDLLDKLRAQSCKDVAVVCPSFISDCLETLEEIGIQAQQQWQRAGGRKLVLIPCINAQPNWLAQLL